MKSFKKRELLLVSNVMGSLLRREFLYSPQDAYALHRIKREIDREAQLIRAAIADYIKYETEQQQMIAKWNGQKPETRKIAELNEQINEHQEKNKKVIEKTEGFLDEKFGGKLKEKFSLDLLSSGVRIDKEGKEHPLRISEEQMAILGATILE